MAELDTSSGGGKKGPGVKKAKKLSTKIDLTPMVDLGFLLITFFIFTTTMSKPKTLELSMPKDDENIKKEDLNKVKASTVLTALLSKDHRVYYYYGIGDDPMNPPKLEASGFRTKGGVRDGIITLKKNVNDLKRTPGSNITDKDEPTVIIKPDTNSTYEDVVNMLDEMTINDIKVYAIVEIGKEDRNFIAVTEAANGVK
jgi:biopolymer transport protein ExbD